MRPRSWYRVPRMRLMTCAPRQIPHGLLCGRERVESAISYYRGSGHRSLVLQTLLAYVAGRRGAAQSPAVELRLIPPSSRARLRRVRLPGRVMNPALRCNPCATFCSMYSASSPENRPLRVLVKSSRKYRSPHGRVVQRAPRTPRMRGRALRGLVRWQMSATAIATNAGWRHA